MSKACFTARSPKNSASAGTRSGAFAYSGAAAGFQCVREKPVPDDRNKYDDLIDKMRLDAELEEFELRTRTRAVVYRAEDEAAALIGRLMESRA